MTWLLVVCCLVISFVFSGIEAGILSVNRVRLRHRMKMRDRAALRLNRLLSRPEQLLVTVLLVTNLANIFAIALTTNELVRRLGGNGYFVAFAIFLPVYLMGVELLQLDEVGKILDPNFDPNASIRRNVSELMKVSLLTLQEMITHGGVFLWVIMALGFVAVVLSFYDLLTITVRREAPRALIKRAHAQIADGDFRGAYQMCLDRDEYLAKYANEARPARPEPKEIIVEAGQSHNWFFTDSILNNKPSRENAEEGHYAAAAAHMCNMAYRKGTRVTYRG